MQPISIVVMRRNGLAFVKGKGHIPEFPMKDLTGPEAAARIPTRAVLLSVLATGIYAFIPDPPPAPAPAAPPGATQPAADPPPESEATHAG